MLGETAEAFAFVVGLAAVGAGTHAALYGRGRAPAGRVHLSWRQWGTVGAITAVPAGALGVLLASAGARAALAAWVGPGAPGAVVAFGLLALVAVACGVAPSLREANAPPDDSAPAV